MATKTVLLYIVTDSKSAVCTSALVHVKLNDLPAALRTYTDDKLVVVEDGDIEDWVRRKAKGKSKSRRSYIVDLYTEAKDYVLQKLVEGGGAGDGQDPPTKVPACPVLFIEIISDCAFDKFKTYETVLHKLVLDIEENEEEEEEEEGREYYEDKENEEEEGREDEEYEEYEDEDYEDDEYEEEEDREDDEYEKDGRQ